MRNARARSRGNVYCSCANEARNTGAMHTAVIRGSGREGGGGREQHSDNDIARHTGDKKEMTMAMRETVTESYRDRYNGSSRKTRVNSDV